MKTTVDIADNILEKARNFSKKESIPLKVLVEEGLETVLARHEQKPPLTISPVTFKGKGLADEFKSAPWSQIRDQIYS